MQMMICQDECVQHFLRAAGISCPPPAPHFTTLLLLLLLLLLQASTALATTRS
jgi:hypothetical protein